MKRKMSLFLSIVMALQLALPFFPPVVTRAAEVTSMNVTYNSTLTEGDTSPIPVIEENLAVGTGEALITWNINKNGSTDVGAGVYVLDYFVDNGEKVTFTVDKRNDGSATVTYDLFNVINGSAVTSDWTIWDNNRNRYVTRDAFVAPGGFNAESGLYDVDRTPASVSKPTFIVSDGRGFSFRYDAYTIMFRWEGDNMYFLSNGFNPGRIFDVNLSYGGAGSPVPIPNPIAQSKKYIFTGINTDTFKAIPVANEDNTLLRLINGEEDVDYLSTSSPAAVTAGMGKVDTDPLILDNEQNKVDNIPANGTSDLILRFDLPMAYDYTKNTFTRVPTENTGVVGTITLAHKDIQKRADVTIKDIFNIADKSQLGVTNNIKSATFAADAELLQLPLANGGKRVHIRIPDIESSMLFSDVTFSLGGGKQLYTTPGATPVGFGIVYTFLNYNLEPGENGYAVVFEPYEDYFGTYTLLSDTEASAQSLDQSPTVEMISDGTNEIRFPVSLTSTVDTVRAYQILFTPGAENDSGIVVNQTASIYSQIIVYTPEEDDSTIATPKDFTVVTHSLIPSRTETNLADLSVTAKWSVAPEAMLDKLMTTSGSAIDVTYNMYAGLQPNADPANQERFAVIDAHIVRNAAFDPSKAENDDNPKYTVTYTINYMDDPDTVPYTSETLTDQPLKFEGSLTTKTYYFAPEFSLLDAIKKGATVSSAPHAYFQYPNIYFLSVQPVFNNIQGSYSNPDSLTLDDITGEELPPVQNLEVLDVTTSSTDMGADKNETSATFGFTLPGSEIKSFAENSFDMDEPHNLAMNYNLYISTGESLLVSNFGKLKAAEGEILMDVREKFVTDNKGAVFPYDPSYDANEEGIFYFSSTGEENAVVRDSQTALDALRKGGIVMLKDVPISAENMDKIITDGETVPMEVKVDGLDKNQKYYVYVDFETSFEPASALYDPIEADSILSNAVSFTTEEDIDAPGEEEKNPPSPILNKKDISLDQATVYWNKLSVIMAATETIEYQVVRLRNVAMDNDMLEHTEEISSFLEEIPAGAEEKVFEVDIRNDLLMIRDAGGNFETQMPADEYELDTEDDIEVTDKDLLPNQIYYYYVRTKRTVEVPGEEDSIKYSTWNYISVTTTPISEPINLEVDRSDREAYDPYTEAILAFDAPVGNLEALQNGDYSLQYKIKKEGEDWSQPVTMPFAQLVSSESLTDGYMHFKYKVTGLEPSTAYSFTVRMIDKNLDASVDSNIATTRTEYDPTKEEDERERSEWIQELQRQLRELLKQPYWYTADSNRTLSAIYRPTMFGSLLQSQTDSQVDLPESALAAREFNYYIPASAILAADSSSKGFSFTQDSLTITLPAKSFSMDTSDVLKSVAADIKEGRIEDYYVRVSVSLDDIGSINGKDALTDEITVGFEAYGSTEDNTDFDNRIYAMLNAMVESDAVLDKAEEKITQMLDKDAAPEEILDYISDYVQDVRADMMNDTEDELNGVERRSQTIDSVSGTYTISVTPAAGQSTQSTIEGFRNDGGAWAAQTTMPFGAGQAIYAALAGSYAFAATVVDIAGLENLPYYNELAGVIGKYGLMDYIGADVDVNGYATGQMVAGIVSRITGAPKGSDPYAYLGGKGLSVSSRTQYTAVSNQESLYMLMYIYENKTNTKIATVAVRNFGAANGVTSLDARYKKSVQIALQEGISTKTNMNAAEKMTVKELLEALSRLNQKVRL